MIDELVDRDLAMGFPAELVELALLEVNEDHDNTTICRVVLESVVSVN